MSNSDRKLEKQLNYRNLFCRCDIWTVHRFGRLNTTFMPICCYGAGIGAIITGAVEAVEVVFVGECVRCILAACL